jgi:transcriptional regulator CtsR
MDNSTKVSEEVVRKLLENDLISSSEDKLIEMIAKGQMKEGDWKRVFENKISKSKKGKA